MLHLPALPAEFCWCSVHPGSQVQLIAFTLHPYCNTTKKQQSENQEWKSLLQQMWCELAGYQITQPLCVTHCAWLYLCKKCRSQCVCRGGGEKAWQHLNKKVGGYFRLPFLPMRGKAKHFTCIEAPGWDLAGSKDYFLAFPWLQLCYTSAPLRVRSIPIQRDSRGPTTMTPSGARECFQGWKRWKQTSTGCVSQSHSPTADSVSLSK